MNMEDDIDFIKILQYCMRFKVMKPFTNTVSTSLNVLAVAKCGNLPDIHAVMPLPSSSIAERTLKYMPQHSTPLQPFVAPTKIQLFILSAMKTIAPLVPCPRG